MTISCFCLLLLLIVACWSEAAVRFKDYSQYQADDQALKRFQTNTRRFVSNPWLRLSPVGDRSSSARLSALIGVLLSPVDPFPDDLLRNAAYLWDGWQNRNVIDLDAVLEMALRAMTSGLDDETIEAVVNAIRSAMPGVAGPAALLLLACKAISMRESSSPLPTKHQVIDATCNLISGGFQAGFRLHYPYHIQVQAWMQVMTKKPVKAIDQIEVSGLFELLAGLVRPGQDRVRRTNQFGNGLERLLGGDWSKPDVIDLAACLLPMLPDALSVWQRLDGDLEIVGVVLRARTAADELKKIDFDALFKTLYSPAIDQDKTGLGSPDLDGDAFKPLIGDSGSDWHWARTEFVQAERPSTTSQLCRLILDQNASIVILFPPRSLWRRFWLRFKLLRQKQQPWPSNGDVSLRRKTESSYDLIRRLTTKSVDLIEVRSASVLGAIWNRYRSLRAAAERRLQAESVVVLCFGDETLTASFIAMNVAAEAVSRQIELGQSVDLEPIVSGWAANGLRMTRDHFEFVLRFVIDWLAHY